MRIKAAGLAALVGLAGCSAKKPEVRLFTWDSYDDPAVFEQFEKETGIHVAVDRFASNEELLAKLMGGAKGYDIIVPSDYMVSIMAREGILEEIDKSRLPHLANIDSRFRGLYYDPENRFSVPYLWSVSGIGYDSAQVTQPPSSWGVFWDPRYKDRISLLNDEREVFSMALQYLGHSPNSPDPKVLEKAKERLVEQKRLVKTYNSESVGLLLISGEVAVAHAWAGDVNRAALEKPSLRFIVPKEGGFIFQDNFCIPKTAVNKDAALKLIDYLLDAKNAARVVEKTRYGTPNKASWALLPPEMQEDPTIVPQDALLRKLQWIHDLGESAGAYDRLWTELKAG